MIEPIRGSRSSPSFASGGSDATSPSHLESADIPEIDREAGNLTFLTELSERVENLLQLMTRTPELQEADTLMRLLRVMVTASKTYNRAVMAESAKEETEDDSDDGLSELESELSSLETALSSRAKEVEPESPAESETDSQYSQEPSMSTQEYLQTQQQLSQTKREIRRTQSSQ